MTEPALPAPPAVPTVAWWVLGCLAVHGTAFGLPQLAQVDLEEGCNVAQAALAPHVGLLEAWRLQYKAICGGCSLLATLAVPSWAVSGGATWGWKVAPWIVDGLGAWGVLTLAGRLGGTPGVRATAVLLALAPPMMVQLLLRGWGTHAEAAAVAMAALAAWTTARTRRQEVWAGMLGGLAAWIGLSALPLIAAIPVLALRHGRGQALRRWAAGMLSWHGLWIVGWVLGGHDPSALLHTTSGLPDDLLVSFVGLWSPSSMTAIWGDAATLPGALTGPVFALLGAYMLLRLARQHPPDGELVAVAALGWCVAYALGRFQIALPATTPEPFDVRYAAPLGLLLITAAGAGCGALAARRPALAAVLVALAATPGASWRLRTLHETEANALWTHPTPMACVRNVLVEADLTDAAPWRCAKDAYCGRLAAFREGVRAARSSGDPPDTHRGAWLAGLGRGLAHAPPETPTEALLSTVTQGVAAMPDSDREHAVRHAALGMAPNVTLPPAWSAHWAWAAGYRSGHGYGTQVVTPRAPPTDMDPIAWLQGAGEGVASRGDVPRLERPPLDWPASHRAAFEAGVATARAE